MEKHEYIQLKRQVEEKYQKAVSLAEKERSEGLKAIETVWNMLGDGETTSPDNHENNLNVPDGKMSSLKAYGSLTTNVKKALNNLPEVFDKNDILAFLGYEVNENSMSGCLYRLEHQRFIVKVEPGAGRRPTKYKKATKKGLLYNE